MDKKPMPEVACRECWKIQAYRGQKQCIHCEKPLVAIPPWSAERMAQKAKQAHG